jgi:hypothetical protein
VDKFRTKLYEEVIQFAVCSLNPLIDLCTEYADPSDLVTSTTIPSYFEYNEDIAKDRFILTEESADKEFYEWNTIEFI